MKGLRGDNGLRWERKIDDGIYMLSLIDKDSREVWDLKFHKTVPISQVDKVVVWAHLDWESLTLAFEHAKFLSISDLISDKDKAVTILDLQNDVDHLAELNLDDVHQFDNTLIVIRWVK